MAPTHYQMFSKNKFQEQVRMNHIRVYYHSSFFKPQKAFSNHKRITWVAVFPATGAFSRFECMQPAVPFISELWCLRWGGSMVEPPHIQTPPLPKCGDIGASQDAARA